MLEEPRCSVRNCKHLIGVRQQVEGSEENEKPYCKAFPEGIPAEIAYGDNLHLEPYKGDHGIQYERAEDEALQSDSRLDQILEKLR